MIFPQMLLDLNEELLVDLFAGGGGASCGIEMATGRQVDLAVNHDAAAVALHQANHPQTKHHVCDVFEVDPHEVTQGRPVGLLWASPDCTYHSKARGAKPIRDKKRRALAWVVTRWAGQVRPRVIALENVEEFARWGPLRHERPCPKRRGKTFRKWVASLERLGYVVEWRELRACDYGAPTIRKRLFVIARCDGAPIVWPAATHGPGRKPYHTAAECIDWSIPMLSIFATREEARAWGQLHHQPAPVRPLAEATLRRVARGVMRYVVHAARPFIVPIQNYNGSTPAHSADEPLRTVTAYPKGGGFAVAAPYLVPRYGEREGQEPRVRSVEEPMPAVVPTGNGGSLVAAQLATYYGSHGSRHDGDDRIADLDEPLRTQTTENRHALVGAFMARHWGGMVGKELTEPHPTVLTKGAQDQVVAVSLAKLRGTSSTEDPAEPLHTVSAGGTHHGVVAAFLDKYYGTDQDPKLREPLHTITTKDRFGLVTVSVDGQPYYIADIAMRMLQPRELYRAQGFPDTYVIDRGADGRRLTKTEQVRMVGNSVCPPIAAAIVRANLPELRVRDEAAA